MVWYSNRVLSQNITFDKKTIEYFVVDNLANIFVITNANELVKIDSMGRFVGNYREQVLGRLQHISVENPMKIVCFYPEVSQIVLLDNMLNAIERIKLNGLALSDNSLLCRSFDNNFWLYDERNFQLKKINQQGETIIEGAWLQNLDQLNTQNINAIDLIEHQQMVYLNLENTGILVFDRFANYKNTLPFMQENRLQFANNSLIYKQDSNFYSYDLTVFESKKIDFKMPLKNPLPQQIFIINNKLYTLQNNRISILRTN